MADDRTSSEWHDPESQQAATSIVVLAHNQLEYTRRCLDSIWRHTRSPYEVIVVDNGSSDGTAEQVRALEASWGEARRTSAPAAGHWLGTQVIRHATNLGYAEGNNAGMAAARFPYVVLMNNDVVVTDDWLGRLLECRRRLPSAGLVGPMTNFASGPQLLGRVGYDATSLAGLDAFAADWHREHVGETVRFWRVVGFCMLIDRRVIERIGGLDPRYGLGNFDDDDYCIRAAIAGFHAVIARDCFVHHYGSRTFADQGIDYQRLMLTNWAIFKQKWGLPPALPYGVAYNLDWVLEQHLDPERHRVPLAAAHGVV